MIALLIALLVVLGVDLAVLVVFVLAVLGRRRWLSRQDGAFSGVAHVVDGAVPGLGTRPRRGYGRWVRDVLVWTPAPFFLRNALAAIDGVETPHESVGKVRRLGDNPMTISLASGSSCIELTVRRQDASRVTTRFGNTGHNTVGPATGI